MNNLTTTEIKELIEKTIDLYLNNYKEEILFSISDEILYTLYLFEFKNLVLYCGKYKIYIAVQMINNAAIYGIKNLNIKVLFLVSFLLPNMNTTSLIKLKIDKIIF